MERARQERLLARKQIREKRKLMAENRVAEMKAFMDTCEVFIVIWPSHSFCTNTYVLIVPRSDNEDEADEDNEDGEDSGDDGRTADSGHGERNVSVKKFETPDLLTTVTVVEGMDFDDRSSNTEVEVSHQP